jgi:hypothetical protein
MLKKISLIFLSFFVVVFSMFNFFSGSILTSLIYSSLEKKCPKCDLHIEKLQLSWIPNKVLISGIQFQGDSASNPVVNFSADEVEAQFKFVSLIQGTPTMDLLEIGGLHLTLLEPAYGGPSSGPDYPPPGTLLNSLPAGRVNQILIHDSDFTYKHPKHREMAEISVQNIELKTGSFVTRDKFLEEDYNHPLEMSATARLENSGKVLLNVSCEPFAQNNHDKILIQLLNHKMSTVDKFFKIEEGVRLSGVLQKGLAVMSLKNGQLSGTLSAAYKDFGFEFLQTPDNGPVKCLLANVAQGLTVSKNRPKNGVKAIARSPFLVERQPREPITQLLIRGLLEAAKKIITS